MYISKGQVPLMVCDKFLQIWVLKLHLNMIHENPCYELYQLYDVYNNTNTYQMSFNKFSIIK